MKKDDPGVRRSRRDRRVAVLESQDERRQARSRASSTSSAAARRSIVGNIYKGKVDNVLPGMEAAFVDIGLERNGFLHVDEIVLPDGEQAPERAAAAGPPDRRADQARSGDPRPGRQGPAEDEGRAALDERLDRRPLPRLRAAGRAASASAGASPTRSASACARWSSRDLRRAAAADRPHRRARRQEDGLRARDRATCTSSTRCSSGASRRPRRPSLVFQEADLPVRVLRDVFLSEFETAIIDDAEAVRPGHRLLPAHRAGAGRRGRAVRGQEAAVREMGDREGDRVDAGRGGSTCPRAAT